MDKSIIFVCDTDVLLHKLAEITHKLFSCGAPITSLDVKFSVVDNKVIASNSTVGKLCDVGRTMVSQDNIVFVVPLANISVNAGYERTRVVVSDGNFSISQGY